MLLPGRPPFPWRAPKLKLGLSGRHAPIDRFVSPDEFQSLERIARAKGFLMVSASPLTRSSYHAGEDFAQLRAARAAKLGQSA